MPFETYAPERRGRIPDIGAWARLSRTTTTWTLRITRGSLALIGIEPQRGDHLYFIVEADRESGAIRFTQTDNVGMGRMMNPMNRQINVGKRFADWTGWGESRWLLRVEDGSLVGDTREPINIGEAG